MFIQCNYDVQWGCSHNLSKPGCNSDVLLGAFLCHFVTSHCLVTATVLGVYIFQGTRTNRDQK